MSAPHDNPWGEGMRARTALESAGFEIVSWNLYPESGLAQFVVDLKVKHPNESKDEGTTGS